MWMGWLDSRKLFDLSFLPRVRNISGRKLGTGINEKKDGKSLKIKKKIFEGSEVRSD